MTVECIEIFTDTATQIFSLEDWTTFRRNLQYVIAGLDTPKGLVIKSELDEYYSQEIHPGRLYPNLDTLVDKGVLRIRVPAQSSGVAKAMFGITRRQ